MRDALVNYTSQKQTLSSLLGYCTCIPCSVSTLYKKEEGIITRPILTRAEMGNTLLAILCSALPDLLTIPLVEREAAVLLEPVQLANSKLFK